MSMLIALALAAATVGVQEKTYDLKFDTKPVQGRKSDQSEKEFMKMIMKVNGQAAAREEQYKDFAASEEVLSVDPEQGTKRRWTFSKAKRKSEGSIVPYTFQGKSVVLTHAKGKEPLFVLEGEGELTKEDVDGLKSYAGLKKSGGPSGAELFAPDKPVKAGETWTKDLKKIVDAMLGPEMAKSIDLAASKFSFALKSVENRGGAEFGKISGSMELSFTAFGPLKLDQPIPMKFTVEIDACIDGKLPDGEMKMRGEMFGKSPTTTEKGQIEIEMDLTMEGTKSIKSSK